MRNPEIAMSRQYAETMNLDGNYKVVDEKGIVRAFNLPKSRAEEWAKWFKGGKVVREEK